MTAPSGAGLLIVVGLRREARIAKAMGAVATGVAGLAAALDGPGGRATGILSFGLCGALEVALDVGDLVVPEAVICGGETYPADAAWTSTLRRRLSFARGGLMAAGDRVVGSADAKVTLRRSTGAVAVDMESHAVARAAKTYGLPFAVVRAVSDSANADLPRAAEAGFKTGPGADGEPDIAAVIGALIRRPWELAALIRTGRDAETAFKALERAASALTPPGQ